MKWLLAFALGTVLHPGAGVKDIDGAMREPLRVAKGHAAALFFVTHDCPVSNYYAHEIQRTCADYAARGLSCALIYTDSSMSDDAARKHAAEYRHGDYPKIVDRAHVLVHAAGVQVNPTAVLIRDDESIAYRGRIDNRYAALGKPRQVVTEHDLRDAIESVLAGKPVAKPETQPIGCYIEPPL